DREPPESDAGQPRARRGTRVPRERAPARRVTERSVPHEITPLERNQDGGDAVANNERERPMTTKTTTKTIKVLAMAAVVLGFAGAARAEQSPAAAARADVQKTFGFVPQFVLKLPDSVLPGVWAEMKGLQMNPSTALPGRTKELIGLGVAAQVPCRYCV